MATIITSRDQLPNRGKGQLLLKYINRKDMQVSGDWDEYVFILQNSRPYGMNEHIEYFHIKGKDLRRWAVEEAIERRLQQKIPVEYTLTDMAYHNYRCLL